MSDNSSQPDNKKARHGYDKGVDRISKLAEPIILHILSFLKLEDAVRTGFLSKRFAYSWTYLDRLEFVDSHPEFIDNTLFLHNRSNLQAFSLIYQRFYPGFKFDRWIQVLFRFCPVKDLTLKFNYYTGKRLPPCFYSNSSLITLNLLGCEISLKDSLEWECLRTLTISDTNFLPHTHSMNDIFSGCPCLEFLELSNCEGFTKISLINNKCFKKLVIRDYGEVNTKLEILAPTLESFVLSGCLKIIKCKVVFSNCLNDCCLDFCIPNYYYKEDIAMDMLASLLEDVCHVKEVITIGEWGLQVVSLIHKKGDRFALSKCKVRCLKLYTDLSAFVMGGIKWLLRHLNCLEELYITKSTCNNKMWFGNGNMSLRYNDMETGYDLKLKSVEIRGFTPMNLKDELFFLVIFLLCNETCLETLIVTPRDSFLFLDQLLSSWSRSE